jgi:hypothetical protein
MPDRFMMSPNMARRFAETLVQSNRDEPSFVVQLDDVDDMNQVANELNALGYSTQKNQFRCLIDVTPPNAATA